MTKNYLKKLLKYINKVYDIGKGLENLTDDRSAPTYKTYQSILPVLLGFLKINPIKMKAN